MRVARPDISAGIYARSWPSVLPDDQHALVQLKRSTAESALDSASIGIIDIETGVITDLHMYLTHPRFASPGYVLLRQRDGSLAAARYRPGYPTRATKRGVSRSTCAPFPDRAPD